ncbi:MAG: hypothetical protein IH789_09560 [Acidobacteria bacterium]|nr:hypothetical protein [Acidobacteriota bacterium]
MAMHRSPGWPVHFLMVLLLPVPPALFLACPLWAEELQVSVAETDWNNLQRLSLAARLLIERSDGTRVKGRLISVADDALSVRKGKRVVGVARAQVSRVWLFGETKTGKGAMIGALVGGISWPITHAFVNPSERAPAAHDILPTLLFAGAGSGIGAAVGASVRERILVYRAPPPGQPSTAATHTAPCEAPADRAACADPPSAPGPFPAFLEEVSRPFNAERAVRELARKAGIK